MGSDYGGHVGPVAVLILAPISAFTRHKICSRQEASLQIGVWVYARIHYGNGYAGSLADGMRVSDLEALQVPLIVSDPIRVGGSRWKGDSGRKENCSCGRDG